MKLLIGSIFLILTSVISKDTEVLKDPYPVWGKVYLFQPKDSINNSKTQDTIFLENVEVFAMADSEIIAKTKTDKNGKYKLEFPVKYYYDNYIYIVTQHSDFKKASTQTSLFGYHYAGGGMQCDFGLESK